MINVSRRGRVVATAIVIGAGLICLFPLYWMVVIATHTNQEFYRVPPPVLPGSGALENLRQLTANVDILHALWNSVYVALVHSVLVLFFCSLAGYGFSRFRSAPGHRGLYAFTLATIMIPPAAGLIPWFVEMKWLGWLNSYWPMIVPNAANAFGIFWMKQYIDRSIPPDLYEAARIDGASDLWTYGRVVVPLIRPGLGALGIWTFLATWNLFLVPLLVLNDKGLFTLPLALTGLQSLYGTNIPATMLGTAIGVAPLLIAFCLFSRQFIAGLTGGAVKE